MRKVIHQATEQEWPALAALLTANNLPLDGLRDHLAITMLVVEGERVVGSAALELYGDAALLRSVAVATDQRGQGLGQQLTQVALEMAQRCGVQHVYLLTETAADFFPRFGFQPVVRAQVPEAVRQSVEFTSACPQSALTMEYTVLSHTS